MKTVTFEALLDEWLMEEWKGHFFRPTGKRNWHCACGVGWFICYHQPFVEVVGILGMPWDNKKLVNDAICLNISDPDLFNKIRPQLAAAHNRWKKV